ncbi:MAG: AsnC family protein [Gammaproteobacteria bacterium]|nr:MAG: AsnC family protein [Gammaproteobacteria bacterium]
MTSMQSQSAIALDDIDKKIINVLQRGLPVCVQPFAEIAQQLAISEQEILNRLDNLLDNKVLSRFGPMFDAACFGGAFTLAALQVAEENFEEITKIVNDFEQIAHNYKRDHQYNMWFVIATESQQEIAQVIAKIEQATGLEVLNAPKLKEFYVGLYLPA